MARPIGKQFFGPAVPGEEQIAATAWVEGDTQARTGFITRQSGPNRYHVETSFGESECELVEEITEEKQMTIQVRGEGVSGIQLARKITDREVYTFNTDSLYDYFEDWIVVNGQLISGNVSVGNSWLATYGDITSESNDTIAEGIAFDSTGNLIACGQNSGTYNANLIKFDPTGTILWQKELYDGYRLVAECVLCDSDDNIYTIVQNTNNDSGTLVKLNPNGEIIWQQKLLNGPGISTIVDIAVGADGCSAYACHGSNTKQTIIKYNANGTLAWSKNLGDNVLRALYSGIGFLSTGELIIANGYHDPGSSKFGISVRSVSADGTTTNWVNSYELPSGDSIGTVADLALDVGPDDSIVATVSTSSGSYDYAWIAKFTSSGSLSWQKLIGGDNVTTGSFTPYAIKVSSTGKIFSVGRSNNGIGLVLQNSDGSLAWSNEILTDGEMGVWWSWGSRDAAIFGNDFVGAAGYQSTPSLNVNTDWVIHLPADGSNLGTYGIYTYQALNCVESTATWATSTITFAESEPAFSFEDGDFTTNDGLLEISLTEFQ
jgi:hypothetical protein